MIRFFLVALMIVVCVMQTANAQNKALTQFPVPVNIQTLDEYSKVASPVNFIFPDRDPHLDFTVMVPNNWEARQDDKLKNLQTSNRLFGYLAWYDAPGEGDKARPYLTVRSVSLDHEISAKSWLIGHMFDNAYSLRALRERSLDDVEAVYVTHDKLVTYTTWARAYVMGPRVLLFEYHVPSETWKRDRDNQYWTMTNLEVEKKDTAAIEKMRAFAFLDVATFQYPESWELFRNIVKSPDFFRVALFNASINETPSTQITVQATRLGGSIKPEIMAAEEQKYLEKQNVVLNDLVPAPNFIAPDAKVTKVKNQVFKLADKPRNYQEEVAPVIDKEYWITTFEKNGVSYSISMFIPARDAIYKDWARGTRAYQIIIGTIAGNLLGQKDITDKNTGSAIPFLN